MLTLRQTRRSHRPRFLLVRDGGLVAPEDVSSFWGALSSHRGKELQGLSRQPQLNYRQLPSVGAGLVHRRGPFMCVVAGTQCKTKARSLCFKGVLIVQDSSNSLHRLQAKQVQEGSQVQLREGGTITLGSSCLGPLVSTTNRGT